MSTHFATDMCPQCTRLLSPAVKVALRYKSLDSEEDRKGLECHLGQGHCSPTEARLATPELSLPQMNILSLHPYTSYLICNLSTI